MRRLSERGALWATTVLVSTLFFCGPGFASAAGKETDQKVKVQLEELQKKFDWWPTDAQPAPVRDEVRGGYWWWPTRPGTGTPWGNRGYVYVYKIIYDYKAEELPPPKPMEPRPSLLIRKIIRNVKVYFDFNKAGIRDDAALVLEAAVKSLQRNPKADILITGNCDVRGSEAYNEKLGRKRAEAVKQFVFDRGIPEERIRIVSQGKLNAVAPVTDLVGMQKDRNAQFMVAEVEEVMIPYTGQPPTPEAKPVEEGKYLEEKQEELTGEIRVSTREYVIREGDSLARIAKRELGSPHRWRYLYELNKDRIKNPNKLKPGTTIIIPVE